MEIREDVIYPVEEIKEEGRALAIKAGKNWVEDRIKKYEGILLRIPKELKGNKKTTFVVLGVRRKDYDAFILHLHSHDVDVNELKEPYEVSRKDEFCIIDAGGDVEVTLTVKSDMLSTWTGVLKGELRRAFDTVNLGSTYNVLVSMPRTIVVTKSEITLTFSPHRLVDSMNVCNDILSGKHPIDV